MTVITQIFFDIVVFAIFYIIVLITFCVFRRFNKYKELWSFFSPHERFALIVYSLSIFIQMRLYDFYEQSYKSTNFHDVKIASSFLWLFLVVNFITLCVLLRDTFVKQLSIKLFILAIAVYQVGLAFSITSLPDLALEVKIFAYIVGIQFPAFCTYIMNELNEERSK